MSTRLQIVDTRPRVLPQATRSPVEDLVAGFQSAFQQAKAQRQRAEQVAQERAFRKEMQRLGFEHEDRARGERFAHEDAQAAADRIFRQQAQERLFGHEDTARHETFDFQGEENEANRGVTRRGQDITARGIENDRDLGMRRLSIDAIRAGAEAQHYRTMDAAGAGRASGAITPATVASIVNSAARDKGLLPNEVLPTARERVDSIMSWTNQARGGAPPIVVQSVPRGAERMAAPESATSDSIAEQQAHWDAAAAHLRRRGVKDVEGQIGARPRVRR